MSETQTLNECSIDFRELVTNVSMFSYFRTVLPLDFVLGIIVDVPVTCNSKQYNLSALLMRSTVLQLVSVAAAVI